MLPLLAVHVHVILVTLFCVCDSRSCRNDHSEETVVYLFIYLFIVFFLYIQSYIF